jgi:hypothetical protein
MTMIEAPNVTRTVVVLGRQAPPDDPSELIRRAARSAEDVLILSIGLPVMAGQRDFVAKAAELAVKKRVALSAEIITNVAELAGRVTKTDRLTIDAGGREARRLEAAARRR